MKKVISIILVLLTLLTTISLISCSFDNGYGVSKEMDAEIRAALDKKMAFDYTDTWGDVYYKFKYYFRVDYVEVEIESVVDYEYYHERDYRTTYVVHPDKLVLETGAEIYYIYENGEITYLEPEPYNP